MTGPGVEIRYLGSLEVVAGDHLVAIGSVKQRRLVLALAMHRHQSVGLDTLAGALWEDKRPADVAGSVQSLVSRLRRVLEPAGARISQSEGGYRLEPGTARVDADRFEALLVAARTEPIPMDAADLYRKALSYWRGPALGDLADVQFARIEAARLERLRAEAVEELAEAELTRGAPAAALGLLEAHIAVHPLRERAWAGIMLALYRLGRQAEALQAYRSLRRQLDVQLGLEPTPALRDLERRILNHDPTLDVSADERGPAGTHAGPGPVPEPAAQVAARPPAIPPPPLLGRVGRIFVGRDPQLQRCLSNWNAVRAGERRAVLVTGEPGIGKTRLAAEVSDRAAADGAIVLGGRCDEDLGVPYQPFVEALRHYVAYAGNQLAGRHAGELTRLVPEIADHLPHLPEPLRSDPETERYRLFDAVAEWLAHLSANAPGVLLIDDLHWAAKPTLLLLRHVLRRPNACDWRGWTRTGWLPTWRRPPGSSRSRPRTPLA